MECIVNRIMGEAHLDLSLVSNYPSFILWLYILHRHFKAAIHDNLISV